MRMAKRMNEKCPFCGNENQDEFAIHKVSLFRLLALVEVVRKEA
jgi:hypothetical protein